MSVALEERRAAIVLYVLGREFSDAVLAEMVDGQAQSLRELLNEFDTTPPDADEVQDVVEEFDRFMRFAGDGPPDLSIVGGDSPHADGSDEHGPGDADEEEDDEDEQPPEIKLSNNPLKQLAQLEPYQIAGALQHESPRAIAIVLGRVEPGTAGEVLQYLPEELQNQVVVELCEAPSAPEALLTQLIRTTVEKGIRLDPSAVADATAEALNRVAEILRSMKKNARNQLVSFLDDNNADTAGEIKKKLYVFDDLRKITDRSLQRLLSRVESTTLANSLNGTDDILREKVLSNLSKRARAALEEEMELAVDISEEEREEGQRGICQVMAEMDQEGELALAD